MAIYAEAKESFKLAPQGQFQAVCCEVLDLGYKQRQYKNDAGGFDNVQTHEIQYVFQINQVDSETGNRFEVRSQPFNLVLGEKASLRKFLLAWRGHDLTDAEKRPPGVNVDLTGRNALISIVHKLEGDKTYANISAIMPIVQGMPEIQPFNYKSKQSAVDQANAQASAQAAAQTAPNLPQYSGQSQAAPVYTPPTAPLTIDDNTKPPF